MAYHNEANQGLIYSIKIVFRCQIKVVGSMSAKDASVSHEKELYLIKQSLEERLDPHQCKIFFYQIKVVALRGKDKSN